MRVSLLVMISLMVSAEAAASPPSAREAKAWLALPSGSTSLGRTNGGQLVGAVALPPRGAGYAVLSHALGRKTNFGTAELIAAIERATRAVREAYPGSVLGIGNLGFASGEKIPWSVSHQSGRDGDLGMYATTLDGQPIQAMPFYDFGLDGLATGPGGQKVRFDVPRNLKLVVTLAEDAEARVQYIFVATWLKEMLLAEARRTGVRSETIAKLAELMHQPTDSNPHADHYHVRLFCSVEDRQYGCLNRGPVRMWVDLGDREHAEAARRVASILTMTGRGAEGLHVRALERLGAMMAASEIDAVIAALSSPAKAVRKAALATVITIGDPTAAEGIVRVLPEVTDADWAAALFDAVPALDTEALVPLAERALAPGGVEGLLHVKVRKMAGPKVRIAAIRVLRDAGAARHVEALIALAAERDAGVKRAALDALEHRTCHKLRDAKAYRAWLERHRAEDELGWIERGLGGAKAFPRGMRTKDGVARLIARLAKRPAIRACAARALVALTGHEIDWRLRTPARNKKHWTSWWADNAEASALP